MRWKIAEAKQRFSEVVRRAADEPQVIQNRDRVVAAVISGAAIDEFSRWMAGRDAPSLAETLGDMREAAREESWDLEIPPRADRPNALLSPESRRPRRRAR